MNEFAEFGPFRYMDLTGPPVRVAAVCAGYGGLELGLAMACSDIELVWVSETDPDASKVLEARFDAANLGDLTQIQDPPQVEWLCAGFPCQPVSVAGQRKGVTDERWLIHDICSLARRAGVRRLWLENVPGLLTANDGDAMAAVCSALAHNGFDADWTHIRASDIGAPHRRNRWFCLAHPTDLDSSGRAVGQEQECERRSSDQVEPGLDRAATPDPDGHGFERCTQPDLGPAARQQPPHGHHVVRRDMGPYEPAIGHWEQLTRPAPNPLDNGRLNSRFVEWMMGLPDGWVTDILPRRAALRVLGNGVVPQQAAAAWRQLT